MQTYRSQAEQGAVRTVAFDERGKDRRCFITLSDAAAAQSVVRALGDGHRLLSTTPTSQGTVLIFSLTAPAAETLARLEKDGQTFAPSVPKKKFNLWAVRGLCSIVGQSGQLLSGYLVYDHAKRFEPDAGKLARVKADSISIVGFAVLNLCANVINILFGAQEKNDPNHLNYLKQEFHTRLAGTYGDAANQALNAAAELAPPSPPRSGVRQFLDKYSVSFGEIFLRTLGSISLAFPVVQFKAGWKAFRTQGGRAGFEALKNKNQATFVYGLLMLLGKVTSFFASEPDPYNPAPMTAWRGFREKVAFKLSSVWEGAGAAWSTYDRFKNQKIYIGAKEWRDLPGAAGNAVFVGGYGIRYAAPYGTREVDMPALYQHLGAAIAHLPMESRAEAIASNAHWLAEHFAEKEDDKFRLPMIYRGLEEASTRYASSATHTAPTAAQGTAAHPGARVSQVDAHARMTAHPQRAAHA
jgi:hypothetical protein